MPESRTSINLFVPGLPAPGGSKKAFPINGRVVVTDDAGQRNRDWKQQVAAYGHEAWPHEPLACPLVVSVTFFMPRPKGHYGSGRNAEVLKPSAPDLHTVKPDATKLWRSTEDALSGIVWRDDTQIHEQHIAKVYTTGTPGAEIYIYYGSEESDG